MKRTDECTLVFVQATDKHGMTPLVCACYENQVACVKLLLEKVGVVLAHLATSADELTRRTKGPLTQLCTGREGMSTKRYAAPLSPCFFVFLSSFIQGRRGLSSIPDPSGTPGAL